MFGSTNHLQESIKNWPLPSSIYSDPDFDIDTQMLDELNPDPATVVAQKVLNSQNFATANPSVLSLLKNQKNNSNPPTNKQKRRAEVAEHVGTTKKLKLDRSSKGISIPDITNICITPIENDSLVKLIFPLFDSGDCDQMMDLVLKPITNLPKIEKKLLIEWLEKKHYALPKRVLMEVLLLIANGQQPSLILSRQVQEFRLDNNIKPIFGLDLNARSPT